MTAFTLMQKLNDIIINFRKLGDSWAINHEVANDLEQFTCIMYGQQRETSVNKVRAKMSKQIVGDNETLSLKSKVDFSRIPPCLNSLLPHLQRVNHRVACYKRAHEPIVERPKPYDREQGWARNVNGTIEPVWSSGPILPTSLVDLLESGDVQVDNEDDVDDEDPEPDDILEYLDE